MSLGQRIMAGDNTAAYDVIANTVAVLAEILPQLEAAMVDAPGTLQRRRELAALKPLFGTESVIDGGRQAGDIVTNQETAASECSGMDRRRIAGCAGRCPRATAGQRAGGGRC